MAIITAATDEGRHVLRHSTAHVMAQAVTRLFPGAKFSIGPAIENGFYYDFELPGGATFSDDDLESIEAEMREIVKANQPFVRSEMTMAEAKQLFADQPYKVEIIERVESALETDGTADNDDAAEVGEGGIISAYRNTESFVDMCVGPHVPSTGKLGFFKLQRVSGAYWRGNEKGPMLQRIYGTAWESKQALADHLHQLEEALKRDHRKLATELDLLSFPSALGGGLAVWHPKGAIVRKLIEDYSRLRHERGGYEFVYTPHLANGKLFETSGHLQWYADGMYPPMEMDNGTYYMKPMNCPMHCLIFDSRQRSYRELPLRLFELGTVYRYERAGTLHGLMRIRGFTQDDSHIYCTREQLAEEVASLLDFVLSVLRAFGFEDFTFNLSTKDPDKYVGSDEIWDEATEALRQALEAHGVELRHQGRRCGLLRPQDRRRRPRRDRPVVAALDDPGRLPVARAVRPGVRRRRQQPPPADHVAPSVARIDRAVLRRAHRALRRCVPDVAGAGPGASAARRPGPRGLCRDGRRPAPRSGRPGRHLGGRRRARQTHPQRQAGEDPVRARRR